MKKGFKILIGIILIICICSFILTYYFLYGNKELMGENLGDGVYLYSLDTEEYNRIKVVDHNIYYMNEIDNKYKFYRVNIYNNKKEFLWEISSLEYYCYFDNKDIDCSSETNKILYNYKFKKIYDGENKTVIPYKKGLVTVDNNTIYYKEKEYKRINRDLSNHNVYAYNSFDNNLYIFFASLDSEDCILNVEDNKCENYNYSSIKQYENGLYFVDEDKINVLDVSTKELKEYTNYVKDGYLINSALKDNLLYYFSDDYLKIYNLENGKVSLFEHRFNKSVDGITIDKNLLYIITDKDVYILNLDEIVVEEMTISELETKFDKMISDRIESIQSVYNVEIKVKDEADLKFKVFKESTKGEREFDRINDSLDEAEDVFEMIGSDVFKEFNHGEYTGLTVYLVSDIKSDFDMDGEELRYYDKYAIIARSVGFKRTLCHELMHALEDAVFTKNKKIFKKWDEYNPKDFKYKVDYDAFALAYKYTVGYGKGDVYFIDNYAQTNELEDRARIFENICMNTASDIKENPKLLKKAEYLESEVIKNYPMMNDSIVFASLK